MYCIGQRVNTALDKNLYGNETDYLPLVEYFLRILIDMATRIIILP